ncbi:MAG: inositol monophosphatase family protein [Streptosporangiaceae bacterium]|jgi:myo-inositol-1(or 4)-monophosphatase
MSEPDPAELAGLAGLACALAQEAGEMLWTRRGQVHVVQTKSSPTDVVTEMDRAAEELIRRRLATERPDDSMLGEEGGQTGTGALVRWIVDPLDGTVNYLYGLPDWSVSIAAEVGGTVVAGAVCAPLHRSLYSATAGGGAWLRSAWLDGPQRLACNTGVRLADALVATGFGYESGRRRWQGQVVAEVLPRVRDIRRAGSAALDLCSVAAGRVDGYYERGVHYWDIAAGSLIAREAGAEVAGLAGRPAGESITVAAGQGLFAELHDLLARLDPERDG